MNTWHCKHCDWTTDRVPDHVTIVWHGCRPERRRRRVSLPGILDGDPITKRDHDRTDWFTALYPVPPPPLDLRRRP